MKQSLAGITPQSFNSSAKTRTKQALMSNQGIIDPSGNSTENLFNLIQATKTKNTPVLEPLNGRHQKTDSNAAIDLG